MVITKIALPRRTFIWGMGAAVALPFLDAMLPVMKAQSKAVPRFTAIYCGNGANMFEWIPATTGVGFEMSPTLKPIEAFRDQMLVVTGLDNFQATDQGDVGGQHPRAAPAFMSCVHPKQTEGADVRAGTTIDQMIAGKICRDTKLPSLEVSIDRNDVVGACDHGYACAYMNSMSWKSPTDPLPSETNPRFVFERMFGIGATAEERLARSREDRSILDGLTQEISALRRRLGPGDRTKLGQYFDAVRDVEQRIAKAESTNRDSALPEQPAGARTLVGLGQRWIVVEAQGVVGALEAAIVKPGIAAQMGQHGLHDGHDELLVGSAQAAKQRDQLDERPELGLAARLERAPAEHPSLDQIGMNRAGLPEREVALVDRAHAAD